MAREIGSWLSGPEPVKPGGDNGYPGEALGLPETGPRSLARLGRRFAALIVDWLISYGLAGIYGIHLPDDVQVVSLSATVSQMWLTTPGPRRSAIT